MRMPQVKPARESPLYPIYISHQPLDLSSRRPQQHRPQQQHRHPQQHRPQQLHRPRQPTLAGVASSSNVVLSEDPYKDVERLDIVAHLCAENERLRDLLSGQEEEKSVLAARIAQLEASEADLRRGFLDLTDAYRDAITRLDAAQDTLHHSLPPAREPPSSFYSDYRAAPHTFE